jgi:hypothetical protein
MRSAGLDQPGNGVRGGADGTIIVHYLALAFEVGDGEDQADA